MLVILDFLTNWNVRFRWHILILSSFIVVFYSYILIFYFVSIKCIVTIVGLKNQNKVKALTDLDFILNRVHICIPCALFSNISSFKSKNHWTFCLKNQRCTVQLDYRTLIQQFNTGCSKILWNVTFFLANSFYSIDISQFHFNHISHYRINWIFTGLDLLEKMFSDMSVSYIFSDTLDMSVSYIFSDTLDMRFKYDFPSGNTHAVKREWSKETSRQAD